MNSAKDEISGLQLVIDSFLRQVDDLAVVSGRICSGFDDLCPLERKGLENALPRRREEYATGRLLAHRLLAEIGAPDEPILRGSSREPIWPAGCSGSITHAGDWAVVGLARSAAISSIGLDLEFRDRVTEKLYEKVFTRNERALIKRGGQQLAGPIFSAKEAGYKATFPLGEAFIGFQEAEVLVDPSGTRFRLRYLGNYEPNQIMNRAEGWFLNYGPYVLSVVIIPNRIGCGYL